MNAKEFLRMYEMHRTAAEKRRAEALVPNQFANITHHLVLAAQEGRRFCDFSGTLYPENIQKLEELGYDIDFGSVITRIRPKESLDRSAD